MPHSPPVVTPHYRLPEWRIVQYWTGETELVGTREVVNDTPPSMRVGVHHHSCPNCDCVYTCISWCTDKANFIQECEGCYADRENEHDPDECEDSDCDICNG